MQRYRTVIVDLRKIAKSFIITFILIGILIFSVHICSESTTDKILKNNISIFETDSYNFKLKDSLKSAGKYITLFFIGYLPDNTESVIASVFPIYSSVSDGGLIAMAKTVDIVTPTEVMNIEIPKENQAPIKEVTLAQKSENSIGNETSYSIDVKSMLSSKPEINMKEKGPKILITHTHATESYSPKGAKIYDITSGDRSDDKNKNVVAVGAKVAEIFKEYGIEVIHDTILHDKPSFNGSYAHSLSTVEEYIKKYPSIEIVFDIHRDSIVYGDKTKARPVTKIKGKDAAQLMFVVGSDEKGLYHPDWRENLKTALHFQTAITKNYPNLMRHINLRKERFNGHTTKASMIIEVGSSGNSLDEAIYGASLAAESIAKFLNTF